METYMWVDESLQSRKTNLIKNTIFFKQRLSWNKTEAQRKLPYKNSEYKKIERRKAKYY